MDDWKLSTNRLEPFDVLLWRAMETLRGLSGSAPSFIVAEEIEKYFGVAQLPEDRVWCTKCENHVRKNDPCYVICRGEMLNKRQIKSLANRIEKAKMNIAKQRDILRDLLIEVDEIREHCDEAYDDLDRAIDGLSRLL